MKITSSAFEDNQAIPREFTCDGGDKNPALVIDGVHPSAKSLVFIVDDPDAPGGTWTHWVVWNIKPTIKEIREGEKPEGGVEGITSFGHPGYGGPCPHNGMHRYFFKLYALDTILNIPLTSTVEDVEEAMKGHIVADAKLMGTYTRS